MPVLQPVDAVQTERQRVESLADLILQVHHISQPPVPIDYIVEHPLPGLPGVDTANASVVHGHGLYEFAPRLAAARLLYRELLYVDTLQALLNLNGPLPGDAASVKFFARCLLMPRTLLTKLQPRDCTIEAIGGRFRVPCFEVIVRLAELGIPVRSNQASA